MPAILPENGRGRNGGPFDGPEIPGGSGPLDGPEIKVSVTRANSMYATLRGKQAVGR
jgi:hypothetical protein